MSVHLQRVSSVGVVTLDRPRANAFNEAQVTELDEVVRTLENDPEIRSVLVRSAHPIFCGGADIAMMES